MDWLLMVVLLVAIGLRLFRLGQMPAGFHTDEAFNMFDALRILDGARPVFLPDNAGREALYSYFQAGLVGLLGSQVLSLRLTSALLGVATVPATYLLVRRLPFPRTRPLALLTASLLATSFYHLVFSRYGIRSITVPLLECLAFAAYWGALQCEQGSMGDKETRGQGGKERGGEGDVSLSLPLPVSSSPLHLRTSAPVLKFAVAGVWLGLGASAHPAGRIVPLIPIVFSLYLAWRDRSRARQHLTGLAVMLLVAALVFAPLGYHFWTHPGEFTGHPAEVTVVDPGAPGATLRALATNAVRVLAMFNLHGDEAWWRNLSGRPIFDPLMGLFFLAGVVLLVRPRTRDQGPRTNPVGHSSFVIGHSSAVVFVFLWLGVMLLPTLLADKAPSFSRAVGILPVVFIPPAIALLPSADYLRQRAGPALATAVVLAVLLISAAWTVADYFVVYASSPEMAYGYDQDKVDAADYIRQFHQQGMRVYLSPFLARHPTVRFLTRELELGAFDGEQGLVLPPAGEGQHAAYLFMPNWEPERAQEFAVQLGPLAAPRVIVDAYGRPLLTLYQLDPGQLPREDQPLLAVRDLGYNPQPVSAGAFTQGVELVGYALDRPLNPGFTSRLTLFWRAWQPLARDYTVFVHVVDDREGLRAQHDGWPVGGTYPTHVWRPGELVVGHHSLSVDPAASGRLCVRVGLYLLETGERLPLSDLTGTYVELACGGLESPGGAGG